MSDYTPAQVCALREARYHLRAWGCVARKPEAMRVMTIRSLVEMGLLVLEEHTVEVARKPTKKNPKPRPKLTVLREVMLTKEGKRVAEELGPGRWKKWSRPNSDRVDELVRKLIDSGQTREWAIASAQRRREQALELYERGQTKRGLANENDADLLDLISFRLPARAA